MLDTIKRCQKAIIDDQTPNSPTDPARGVETFDDILKYYHIDIPRKTSQPVSKLTLAVVIYLYENGESYAKDIIKYTRRFKEFPTSCSNMASRIYAINKSGVLLSRRKEKEQNRQYQLGTAKVKRILIQKEAA